MKKLILLFCLLILSSCWAKEDNLKDSEINSEWQETNSWVTNGSWENQQENQEWIIENTTNIINDYYSETLPWAIQDARDVVNDINAWYENMQKEINSLR
jgi:protein involved in sex pheromone biosynthesis